MQDLSLHLLDIAENSVRAGATLIKIDLIEAIKDNKLFLRIKDNGKGMSEQMLSCVEDPFFTTRTTRRVGLGIPLLKQHCEECNGYLKIQSELNNGTELEAVMVYDHIDRLPLGDMVTTMITLIRMHPQVDWVYEHTIDEDTLSLDTQQIKNVLDGLPINHEEVIKWIREYLENSPTKM